MPPTLAVSIVTFATDLGALKAAVDGLLRSLRRALATGAIAGARLIVVDNGANKSAVEVSELLEASWARTVFPYKVISGHGNVGYGQGHNMAIESSRADYHLVMNPDVTLAEDAIVRAVAFMQGHPEVGLLAPSVRDERGEPAHLCKDYPSVLDLALRGFAPEFIKTLFQARLARYELRSMNGRKPCCDVAIVSGSFMFFRRDVLVRTGGFASSYFLYFEDFDLSIRVAEHAKVCYVPGVRIAHAGGRASSKGARHVWMFTRSAATFFSRHGWKWW